MWYTVITGDIVNSRSIDAEIWQKPLKAVLRSYAENYDIYRGDSFQAVLPVNNAMECCIALMANMQIIGGVGVRIGLGVGRVDHGRKNVKESTGEAYIYSGKAFDELGKELFLIQSPWKEIDQIINIVMSLCTELILRWTINMAESFVAAMSNPAKNQTQLAEMLQRKQSQLSRELTKSGYHKIQDSMRYCSQKLTEQCS